MPWSHLGRTLTWPHLGCSYLGRLHYGCTLSRACIPHASRADRELQRLLGTVNSSTEFEQEDNESASEADSCHTASKASEHLTPDHPEDAEADEIVQEVVDQAQAAEVIRPVGSDGSASNEPLHSGNGLVRDCRINPATGATEATAPVAPASLGAGAAHESAHEPVILVAELPRERKGWLVKSPPGLLISTSSRRFAMASSSGSGLRLGERSPNSPFMHMSGSATLNWAKARISAADNSESEEKQARAGVSVRDIVKMVTSRKSRASTTDSSTSSRWYGSVDN